MSEKYFDEMLIEKMGMGVSEFVRCCRDLDLGHKIVTKKTAYWLLVTDLIIDV